MTSFLPKFKEQIHTLRAIKLIAKNSAIQSYAFQIIIIILYVHMHVYMFYFIQKMKPK